MRAKLVKESLGDILVPKSKEDIIKELSNLSQEERNQKLRISARDGQLEVIKLLIEVGANVNDKTIWGGYTALMLASMYGHLNMVKLLIEAGADVNIRNKNGKTALTIASENNRKYIIELLKKYGAKE